MKSRLENYRRSIAQIEEELKKFEKKYKMASDVFFTEFEAGNLGDAADYFEWSSLYENKLLYLEMIDEIELTKDKEFVASVKKAKAGIEKGDSLTFEEVFGLRRNNNHKAD